MDPPPHQRRELRRGLRRIRNGLGPASAARAFAVTQIVLDELGGVLGPSVSASLRAELPPAWGNLIGAGSSGQTRGPSFVERIALRMSAPVVVAQVWTRAVLEELRRQLAYVPPERVADLLRDTIVEPARLGESLGQPPAAA